MESSSKEGGIETVEQPSHYNFGKYNVADVCDDWVPDNPHLWRALCYIARAFHKGNPIEDLKKARWYINRQIVILEMAKAHDHTKELPIRAAEYTIARYNSASRWDYQVLMKGFSSLEEARGATLSGVSKRLAFDESTFILRCFKDKLPSRIMRWHEIGGESGWVDYDE